VDFKKMKSIKLKFLVIVLIITCLGATYFLNLEVSSQKCIDYDCRTIKIPLYLKLLDFFDRHYNYKLLAREITNGWDSEEDRAIAVFNWVTANIRAIPDGFPVIDDHIWNIITRGYGTNDQYCDVFATLCNYAGLDALYLWVNTADKRSRIPLSLVKIVERWAVFDPYNGVYFRNKEGSLAEIKDLRSGNWSVEGANDQRCPNYAIYLSNLPEIDESGLHRSNIQSPLRRLLYQIKRKLK